MFSLSKSHFRRTQYKIRASFNANLSQTQTNWLACLQYLALCPLASLRALNPVYPANPC
jgi:hypothetical protein